MAYRASAAEPKTASCVPSLSSGEATGARGAANIPQSTAAKSGAASPRVAFASSPPPVRTPQ